MSPLIKGERYQIYALKKAGNSSPQISEIIGRHQEWGVPVFFCTPYSSRERGANENTRA